jgi:hypothetical protein
MKHNASGIPDFFYRADSEGTPPTFTALEDGHKFLTYNDPGQTSWLCLPLAGYGLHL